MPTTDDRANRSRPWVRPVLALAGTRPGSALLRALLVPLDGAVDRVTRGRSTFTALLVPTLVLITTGRRTGHPREAPLVYLRDGADLLVVGSNWGGAEHPAWTANLLADPRATVRLHGREIAVRASMLADPERERRYRAFEALGSNYRSYRARAGDRVPRVFRLSPLDGQRPR